MLCGQYVYGLSGTIKMMPPALYEGCRGWYVVQTSFLLALSENKYEYLLNNQPTGFRRHSSV